MTLDTWPVWTLGHMFDGLPFYTMIFIWTVARTGQWTQAITVCHVYMLLDTWLVWTLGHMVMGCPFIQ